MPFAESQDVIPLGQPPPLSREDSPPAAPPPESIMQNLESSLFSVNPPRNLPPPAQEPTVISAPQKAEAVVLDWWEARQSGNLDKALSLFVDRAVVGNRTLSHDELRQSLAADWRKNAAISEAIVGPLRVSTEPGYLKVEHRVSFKLSGKGNGFSARGQSFHTFYLRERGGVLRILEHRDAIIPLLPPSPSSAACIKTAALRSIICGCLEADAAGDLDASIASYGERVSYYGRAATHDDLRADKARYFARWPTRREQFEAFLAVEEKAANQASCSLRSAFRVENPERGDWKEGLAEHHFIITSVQGRAVIVAQSSTVIESRAGTLPP